MFITDSESAAIQNMRTLRRHSLHPDIIEMYYGHLYKSWSVIDSAYVVGLIRGKQYCFLPDSTVPQELMRSGVRIHSPIRIIKGDKYQEICYDLEKIDDRESYKDKKSHYNSVKAPMKFMEKNSYSVSFAEQSDYNEIFELYEQWVQQKLDRGVHRITFPIARYRRCISMCQKNELSNLRMVIAKDINSKIVAFRLILVDDEYAYDIVFCSDLEISQLSNAFNYASIKAIPGIRYFNCGVSTGKLKQYKKQYPNYEVEVHICNGENLATSK